MPRKKKPDNLTLCAVAATNAGMTYGKYMAKYGQYIARYGLNPPAPQPEEPESQNDVRTCRVCGKQYYVTCHLRQFCSDECRDAWRKQKKCEWHKKRRIERGKTS